MNEKLTGRIINKGSNRTDFDIDASIKERKEAKRRLRRTKALAWKQEIKAYI